MRWMRNSEPDRGAVATVVAILGVVLIGMAAISIDVAALWSDRQQLQTGADAGALAIAQACAAGSCGTPASTASTLAAANKNDGAAAAQVLTPNLSPATGHVTVRTTTQRDHWFAPVLGEDSSTVTAEATASWGAPSAGITVLPLAFSWCEWMAQTGGGQPSGTVERIIYLTKSSSTSCTGPSGNVVPGGFGFLKVISGTCTAYSDTTNKVASDPGESPPTGCTPADFQALQNKTVLLPIFQEYGSTGTNAWYRIRGYAAFKITGYYFVNQYSWNGSPQCKGSTRCIKGYFTQYADIGTNLTTDGTAPDLGARVITLTD